MTPEESKAKIDKINQLIFPHTVALMLLPSVESKPADVIFTGSGALVDTGERKLLITCHHVWARFQDHLKEHSEAVIGMPRGAERRVANVSDLVLLDQSSELDLAIIDLTDSTILNGTSKRFASVAEWPPERPSVGDYLVAIGFPGSERSEVDNGENLLFRSTTLMDDVVSVSDRHIALADEEGAREVFGLGGGKLPPGFSFGGMSGCPAFVNRQKGFHFAGVIYESNDDSSGIFLISHADFIRSDGSIDWSRVPI